MGRRAADINDEMVNELRDRLIYEKDTGLLYWRVVNNRVNKVGDVAGFKNSSGYVLLKIGKRRIQAHRAAYAMLHGTVINGLEIDHINGIKSDNRIANLRLCSSSQNRMNISRNKNNTSGVKGVSFISASGKFRAEIMVNRANYYLGEFSTLDKAASAVSSARERLHRNFANHGEFKHAD